MSEQTAKKIVWYYKSENMWYNEPSPVSTQLTGLFIFVVLISLLGYAIYWGVSNWQLVLAMLLAL